MNTQRSSVALRVLIVAALTGVEGDSLDQLNSAELPDGAQVFVLSNASLYRLDKTSTVAAASGTVIVPSSGGPGRYIYESGVQGFGSFQALGTASLTGATAVTDDVWSALPAGSGFYAVTASSGFWSLATGTGIATYQGPTRRMKATGIITIASSDASQAVEAAITINQTLVGTSAADYSAAVANVQPTTAGLAVQLVTTKYFTATDAATCSIAFRDTSASNNVTVSRVNLIIETA